MNRNYLVLLLAAFLAAGCASAPPLSEIAESYLPSVAEKKLRVEHPPLPCQPLTLEEVIKLSLANSRKVEMADRDVEIQGERVLGAISNFLPKVQVSSVWHRRDNQQAMKVDFGGMQQTFAMGEKEIFSGKAQMTIPVFTFGLNKSLYTQAARSKEAAEFAAVRARENVVLEAIQAYFALLDAMGFKDVVEKSLEQIRSHKRVVEEFFNQGLVTKNDLLAAEVRELEMEQQLLIAENNVLLARSNLNRLLGFPLDYLTEVRWFEQSVSMDVSLQDCHKSALKCRAELNQLRKVREAVEAGVSAARASAYPRILGIGAWNYSDDPTQLHKDYWTADVVLEWNIFSGFANTARIGEAKRQLEQVKTQEKELIDAIALQVRSAYLSAKQAIAQIEVARKTVASAEENLKLFQSQYRENLVSSTDVLDAEAQLTRARTNLLSVLHRSGVAIAELENAVGAKIEKVRQEQDEARKADILEEGK